MGLAPPLGGRGPAQAPPRPRRAPAPPALALCAHTPSPERWPRRSDPRRSGRRCSGEPRCACACGSGSDCSTASAVSPLPARLDARGDAFPGRRGTGGALDPREPRTAEEMGLGAGGYGRRMESGRLGPGPPG